MVTPYNEEIAEKEVECFEKIILGFKIVAMKNLGIVAALPKGNLQFILVLVIIVKLGGNIAKIHLDMVNLNATLELDGKVVLNGGDWKYNQVEVGECLG